MCLAVPMQIRSIDEFTATCEAKGVQREVSLFMMQNEGLAPGDHVLVHVGYAIQKVTEAQAQSTWDLLDEFALLVRETLGITVEYAFVPSSKMLLPRYEL